MADNTKTAVAAKSVKFDEIYFDFDRNFRMGSSYEECLPIEGFDPAKHVPNLYEDLKANGLRVPLGLSELSESEAETLSAKLGRKIKYRALQGHRRGRAIGNIREDNDHLFETVLALVYKGLTVADELKIMADHAHNKSLNDFEIFDTVKKLAINTNLSEEKIGDYVGKSRGYVQRRKWILAMPPVVEENYRAKFERDAEGKPMPYIGFTDKDLNTLNIAANVDRQAGKDPADPDSKFTESWELLKARGSASPDEPKAWTRKDMLDKVAIIREPIVKTIILACASRGVEGDLNEAINAIQALRSRIAELESGNNSVADAV